MSLTTEVESLATGSVWTKIVGALLGISILALIVLYCMHLRHEVRDLKANAQATTISTKADTKADVVFTKAHKATTAKKEKASAIIEKAATEHPAESSEVFPDDLADALRDPDAVKLRKASPSPAPTRQVPAAVSSDVPAVPAVQ